MKRWSQSQQTSSYQEDKDKDAENLTDNSQRSLNDVPAREEGIDFVD